MKIAKGASTGDMNPFAIGHRGNLYLLINHGISDTPRHPTNLLYHALCEPQQILIKRASRPPQEPPTHDEEWRQRQCLALLLQYHAALNLADLTVAMGWLKGCRQLALPLANCTLPEPNECVYGIHALVVDAWST